LRLLEIVATSDGAPFAVIADETCKFTAPSSTLKWSRHPDGGKLLANCAPCWAGGRLTITRKTKIDGNPRAGRRWQGGFAVFQAVCRQRSVAASAGSMKLLHEQLTQCSSITDEAWRTKKRAQRHRQLSCQW
jgi:hypothetical protein